jgi:hypothetical protein
MEISYLISQYICYLCFVTVTIDAIVCQLPYDCHLTLPDTDPRLTNLTYRATQTIRFLMDQDPQC